MAFPLIALLVKDVAVGVLTRVAAGRLSPQAAAAELAATVEQQAASDPVLRNEMNAENPWQSRIAVGSVVAAFGVVAPPLLSLFGVDVTGNRIVEIGDALLTLWGSGYALYGRFWPGLAPLFARASAQ